MRIKAIFKQIKMVHIYNILIKNLSFDSYLNILINISARKGSPNERKKAQTTTIPKNGTIDH